MSVEHADQVDQQRQKGPSALAGLAVGCGVVAVVAAVWIYWLVVPGIVLGAAAVVLGLRARTRGGREAGTAAVTLGIVAVLLVPSVIAVTTWAEEWGRDCALNPTNPDC
jgi:ABC-type transport system involved in cytochrome c biogenesis permease subunit